MILYIDSLFAEGRHRVARPLYEVPDTLSRLYVLAMREHDRKAVLLHRADGRWEDTPDWRLDRQVIRLGLFLRERLGVRPGDRVAILSPLRREWVLADFAVVAQGAVAVAIDPFLPPGPLASALAEAAPRVAFVSDLRVLERLEAAQAAAPGLERVVGFDARMPPGRALLLSEVLDLGGTLDTPERAQSFRTQARELAPDAPALQHLDRAADGSLAWHSLTQGDVIARLEHFWFERPARPGDVTYAAGPEVTLAARLALYAFVGDGYSTTALGSPGAETEEILALRPHKIVAPPAVLERAVRPEPQDQGGGGAGGRSRTARAWLARLARFGPDGGNHRGVPQALGGRVRWIRPTAPVSEDISARLRQVVALTLDS